MPCLPQREGEDGRSRPARPHVVAGGNRKRRTHAQGTELRGKNEDATLGQTARRADCRSKGLGGDRRALARLQKPRRRFTEESWKEPLGVSARKKRGAAGGKRRGVGEGTHRSFHPL